MPYRDELTGQTALITGGSKGIGKAIADILYRDGADILLVASQERGLQKAREEILQHHPQKGKIEILATDLRRADNCRRLYEDVTAKSNTRPAILINSAGATRGGDFLELTDDDWQDGFALKFYACMRLCRLFWQDLAANNGRVINIVGGFARTPHPDFMIGGSVNAAMANFSKSLAARGIRDGVRVNVVHPGSTQSDRLLNVLRDIASASDKTPEQVQEERFKEEGVRRLGQPEDIANLVRFLVSREAEHIQGISVSVDGGATKSIF